MQDDGLDVSNKPCYKARKIITTTISASFRASKIMLMLTWHLVMVALCNYIKYGTSLYCVHVYT